MRYLSSTILIAVVLTTGAAQAGTGVRVYAQVDSDATIYPGQAFTYSVVVEGSKPTRIDVSPLARFNPRLIGPSTAMQQDFSGRVSIRHSESYAIVAGPPGTMVLPGVTVVVDGQTYTTNPVEVTVSRPGTTDRMTLSFALAQQKCYVGQPIVMTVEWTVTAQVQDVSFNVPVFRSDALYIEDLSEVPAAYARQQAEIDGVPVLVMENRRLIRGMEAAIISFQKVLIPKQPGRITLDPVTVSTDMATGRIRTNDFFNPIRTRFERFSVHSDPAVLDVLPLPETSKPAQFYGLVGSYTISATATPTQVNVGDPITLTIRIGGNPYLKPVQWPELEKVPGLAQGFKIPSERASPIIENGMKVFTQTVRANDDTVTEIPPIPLAFFDPNVGTYVVARTKPIPLEVSPTKVLTTADVEGTSIRPTGRQVQAIQEGFSANYYGPDVLANQRFSLVAAAFSPGYALVWSVPLLALLASASFKLATRANPEAAARKRKRQACSRAVRRLKAAALADDKSRHDQLASALKAYLGDRFDRVAGSLTADD
ncbi:MAG: BatD family protein, partial [Sedimentisphaerales bacterium]|nr:BatD family protein [Sedimentisphaerales bacterium]